MPPISSISRASTVAKIGRPMKKLTMARLALVAWSAARRSGRGARSAWLTASGLASGCGSVARLRRLARRPAVGSPSAGAGAARRGRGRARPARS